MAGALNRMRNRKPSMAWERWQVSCVPPDTLRCMLLHQQPHDARCLLKEWYEDFLRQRDQLAGALNRMLKRKMSMAWESWQVLALCRGNDREGKDGALWHCSSSIDTPRRLAWQIVDCHDGLRSARRGTRTFSAKGKCWRVL